MWVDDRTTIAWLLLAVHQVGPSEPAELWKVISAMDWINHALPLDDEIEFAVGALVRLGLVSVEKHSLLALTPEGHSFIESCESRSIYTTWDRLAAALRDVPSRGEVDWRANEGVLAEANRRYAAEVRRRR